jgi:hypothetical protein
MKFSILITALTFCLLNLYSQEKNIVKVEKVRFNLLEEMSLKDQFLDSKFYNGTLLFTSGNSITSHFNYNLVLNGISYLDDQKVLYMLEGLPKIKIISYGTRTFVPINSTQVAEVIETYSNGSSLLLHRQSEIKKPDDSRGPYGRTSASSSVVKVSTFSSVGISFEKDIETLITITLSQNYLLLREGKTYPLRNLRSLKKLFPSKWDDAKKFAEEKKFDFKKSDDLIQLIKYCSQ